jgi:GNAT superfamily N-acetyltransferase
MDTVKIIDLDATHEDLYLVCLEDWSAELKESGDHKACWYRVMKEQGLRVKLALDDNGAVGGMIQYVPIEHAPAEGQDLYYVLCIWVHGHKQGRGNFQKKGMGRALLAAAEEDARGLGARGLVTWGLWLPFFMRASWFKKQGYRAVDRIGIQVLLWKPFAGNAVPPRWIRPGKKPAKIPGQVTVTAFVNGWCQAQNMSAERARRACAELGDKAVFKLINTRDRAVMREWGRCDDLFVDDKQVRTGPPPSYEKIKKLIAKRVAKL